MSEIKPYIVKAWRHVKLGRDRHSRRMVVAVRHNVMAYSRREAYYEVMRELPPHDTFDAWTNEERR